MKDFDPAEFKKDYPQFKDLSDDYLKAQYKIGLIIGSYVIFSVSCDPDIQYLLSIYVLAHLLTLFQTSSQAGLGSLAMGRASSASQGSVSVSFDISVKQGDEFWAQTIYGTTILQLMRNQSGFRYIAHPDSYYDNYCGGGYYGY